MQGVAPDAQIITMKVFGQNGGAYDSDYMVAIEDAVLLGCDAVNLSLGASNPGTSRHASQGVSEDHGEPGEVWHCGCHVRRQLRRLDGERQQRRLPMTTT